MAFILNATLENDFTPLCITRTIIMTKTRDIPKAKCQILSIKFDGFLINVSDKFRTHQEIQDKAHFIYNNFLWSSITKPGCGTPLTRRTKNCVNLRHFPNSDFFTI